MNYVWMFLASLFLVSFAENAHPELFMLVSPNNTEARYVPLFTTNLYQKTFQWPVNGDWVFMITSYLF